MKNFIVIIAVAISLGACDSQFIAKSNEQKNQAAEIAAAEAKAQEEKSRQESERKAVEEKKLAEAKSHFNQAFSYIGSSKAASGSGEKEKLLLNAEIELSNAISLKADYAEALMNRGVVYIALGKTNKAEEDLKKAVSLEPKNAAIHYNLASLYALTNKNDLAIDSLDTALKNGFNNVEQLRNDPDLKSLRNTKEFKQVLEKHRIFIS